MRLPHLLPALFLPTRSLTTTRPLLAQHLPVPPLPSLDDLRQSFKQAKIVPDVIDAFDPVGQVFLEWEGDMNVTPGKRINKSQCSHQPQLSAANLPSPGPYLLLTIDPDAPSPSHPSNAPFRHFLQTDLYLTTKKSAELPYAYRLEGRRGERSAWYPPSPPPGSGMHRYVTLFFSQPPNLDLSWVDWEERKKFGVREFVRRSGVGEVRAGAWFGVEVPEEPEGEKEGEVDLGGGDKQVVLERRK